MPSIRHTRRRHLRSRKIVGGSWFSMIRRTFSSTFSDIKRLFTFKSKPKNTSKPASNTRKNVNRNPVAKTKIEPPQNNTHELVMTVIPTKVDNSENKKEENKVDNSENKKEEEKLREKKKSNRKIFGINHNHNHKT